MGRATLFVVGDSISMQYGPHLEKMVAGTYAYARKTGEAEGEGYADLDVPTGANGGDSRMVLKYLEFKARSGAWRPDVLLVNCGLHDVKTNPATGVRQVPLDAYRANLGKIVEIGARSCRTFVWVRTTPIDDDVHNKRQIEFHRHAADVEAYNDAADRIVRAASAASIDLWSFTRVLRADGEVFCDHAHFVEPVRRLQAAFIAGHLLSLAPARA